NGVNYLGYQLTDDLNQKTRDVLWAMDLPEPTEPRRNEGGGRIFLDAFIRGDRDLKLRTSEASILQSLNMMNNVFILGNGNGTSGRIGMGNRILNVDGQAEIPSTVRRLLLDTGLPNDQILEKLYLATLSRFPTDAEKATLMPYFTSMGRQGATE